MEEIFKPVESDKRGEIISLHKQGLNNNQIAIKLNMSRQYIGRVLSDVTSCKPDVTQNAPECNLNVTSEGKPAPQGIPLTNIEVKRILEDFKEDLLEKVQSAVENRVTKAIKYYIENTLESLLEGKIQGFSKDGSIERSKGGNPEN